MDDYGEDLSAYRYLQLDVEDRRQVDAVAAASEELDILVNNAGIALPSQGLDEYEPDIFERAVAMHLTSGYRMARGCHAALSRSGFPGGASIIGIGSMSSYFGMGIVPRYGAAKTGLIGMTRALAVEWAKHGIRVNAVAAGLTESRMNTGTFANPAWTEPTIARTPAARQAPGYRRARAFPDQPRSVVDRRTDALDRWRLYRFGLRIMPKAIDFSCRSWRIEPDTPIYFWPNVLVVPEGVSR